MPSIVGLYECMPVCVKAGWGIKQYKLRKTKGKYAKLTKSTLSVLFVTMKIKTINY